MNAYNAYEYKRGGGAVKHRNIALSLVRIIRAVCYVVAERVGEYELKAAATVLSFFAVVGFIGGMESGAIPFAVGIPICVAIAVCGIVSHFDE